MVVIMLSLPSPMHISKCTFEEFGQNCFKILPFCLNTRFLWLQKFKTRNPLKSIFTEYLYFIVCFNVIRKVISISEIRKHRWFVLGPIVSVLYQPLPVRSLPGRTVSDPWLSEKGHPCWANERWSSNLASGGKNGPNSHLRGYSLS